MEDLQGVDSVNGDLSQDYSNKEKEIVGLDRDLEQIKDHLTHGFPLHLKAISIVGMGGIGKTTLATRLFEDPSIEHYFHIRLWATVSQEYLVSEVLISLLSRLYLGNTHTLPNDVLGEILKKKFGNGTLESLLKSRYMGSIHTLPNDVLGEILYKNLKGRRYLIVMDDVWSAKVFDEVRMYLPDDVNGSRILVTSRLKNLATYFNSEVSHHMNFLNLDDGCKLLHQKLFGKEKFPLELEEIGRKIVKECQGLPLAITVVAGILCKISRTLQCWTKVAENVASHLTEDPTQCLNIIGLSYNHLPSHLKACFLYMGAFPAAFEIPSQRLIMLWIAEGFLDNLENKNSEKVAEEWLEALVERHLILVRKNFLGRIRTCHMHDLLRDFCLREAMLENFLLHYPDASHERIQYPTRVILHSCDSSFNLYIPHIRSLLSFQNLRDHFFVRHKDFRLLTVLDFHVTRFHFFPPELEQLVNLRYLALSIDEGLPSSISNLWNLQVLILNDSLAETILPCEIWKLSQLRHLQCKGICILQDPSGAENDGEGLLLLSNLQTLSKLSLSSCTSSVFAALSNLKKLRIYETGGDFRIEKTWSSYYWDYACQNKKYDWDYGNYGSICTTNTIWSNLENVAQLHQLETLKLIFLNTFSRKPQGIPHLDMFPSKLKELTLSFSFLPWEYMNILCMLPNLEVLKLKSHAFIGNEWEQREEGFKRLKILLLERLELMHWKSTSDHFPCLEHLVLKFCKILENVPLDIGAILTLQTIEVYGCSNLASISAEKIQLEQQSMGNDVLDVHISMIEGAEDLQSEERILSSVYPLSDPSAVDEPHPVPNRSQLNIKDVIFLGLALVISVIPIWLAEALVRKLSSRFLCRCSSTTSNTV